MFDFRRDLTLLLSCILAFLAAVVLLSVGVLDGVVSGAVLGLVWRGAVVVADKIGLKKEVEKARDRLR
jgi:hypothetical protein